MNKELKQELNDKIKSFDEIKKIAADLRNKGKKIVTINGSFDMLHWGHIMSLKEARNQGDILIVGLNSDVSVRKYKSAHRPIIPEEQRSETLAAIEYVDYVVIMDQAEIAVPLIMAVRPDIHANSKEYGDDCVEKVAIDDVGAKLFLIPKYNKVSTTGIIKKIIDIYNKEGMEHCR